MDIQTVANKMCRHLPDDCVIHLCFENGSAWVELYHKMRSVDLPDAADRTLLQQLNDALCVANGWEIKD